MIHLSPLTQRRLAQFKVNKRGYVSFWLFLVLFTLTLFAELIANDKPLLVKYDDSYYFPIVKEYPETTFGGEFDTTANYRDPFVRELIDKKGWMIWPLIPYSYNTVNYELPVPAPAPLTGKLAWNR